MQLVDHQLHRVLPEILTPYISDLVGPNSVDLRLGRQFRTLRYGDVLPLPEYLYDPRDPDGRLSWRLFESDRIVLAPGELILAVTEETVTIPDSMYAVLDGKSTLGRIGLQIHATAGFIDSGFRGQIVLEILNTLPCRLALWAGQLIGQLRIYLLANSPEKPYNSQKHTYQGQYGPQPADFSRIYRYMTEKSNDG